jgi:hypothetical protein
MAETMIGLKKKIERLETELGELRKHQVSEQERDRQTTIAYLLNSANALTGAAEVLICMQKRPEAAED